MNRVVTLCGRPKRLGKQTWSPQSITRRVLCAFLCMMLLRHMRDYTFYKEVLVSSNAAFMLTHMSGESCTVQKGVARYLHFEICSVPLPHQQNVL